MSTNDDQAAESTDAAETLFLGVDGGGTSTVALLGLGDGRVLGQGAAGPSNAKAVGTAAARTALEEAIAGAFAEAGLWPRAVAVACLGVAGFDRPEDKALLGEWAVAGNWADRLVLVNDGDLVVAAGTPEGWGVGLIAGTGSIAVARAADGRKARAGGWGAVFGDEGSAYALAVAALRLVARRIDGRDPAPTGPDALTDALCRALKIDGPGQIVSAVYAPGMDRTKVAALTPAVIDAALRDASLVDILIKPAARELGETAAAAARSLGWTAGPLPLGLAGGFLVSAPLLADALLEDLRGRGYEPIPTRVDEPAVGGLNLARRAFAGEVIS
ncbi:N-acetylglucosamine kinase [Planctomyces sp. SH-PL62]|uniref:N-acetylglucosamine kinase n=1 Tax=Planctomyces sp. SH-PL62 TaxID=1636152 RepID=UPI00078DD970|nr:BadF/BadG/BcrA/BcrD ATPase family protein [Planctomyces sp. SH-PL62]AMV35823.1 BadF/BadG/BcrA/BcrD ATPase family protein [Planctomyces sp. SH-PL62]